MTHLPCCLVLADFRIVLKDSHDAVTTQQLAGLLMGRMKCSVYKNMHAYVSCVMACLFTRYLAPDNVMACLFTRYFVPDKIIQSLEPFQTVQAVQLIGMHLHRTPLCRTKPC